MIKVCIDCGEEFEGSKQMLYCDTCRLHRNREHSRRWWARMELEAAEHGATLKQWVHGRQRLRYVKNTACSKPLAEWAREAAECNLDYGTYRALIECGHTYEELKADAPARRAPIHSHYRCFQEVRP